MVKTSLIQKIALLSLSFAVTVIIIELGFAGWVLHAVQTFGVMTPTTYGILALGESTTAGTGATWPALLEQELNNRTDKLRFRVYNEGVAAADTAYILSNAERNLDKYSPSMVVTMMGVNDVGNIIICRNQGQGLFAWIKNLRTYKLLNFAYAGLRERYELWRMEKAAEKYRQDLLAAPEDYALYNKLGNLYFEEGRLDESEMMFNRSLSIHHTFLAYYNSGRIIDMRGDNPEAARSLFNASLGMNPDSGDAYYSLGRSYMIDGQLDNAEIMLQKAAQLDPGNSDIYATLGAVYIKKGDQAMAARMLEKSISLDPQNFGAILFLSIINGTSITNKVLFRETGLATQEELDAYNLTRYHYRLLRELLKSRNVAYAAMQYPTLNADIIRDFFSGESDILFVSNKENFKSALENGTYDEYFTDNFASDFNGEYAFRGNFGHATEKGNRLIAQNLAGKILGYLNATTDLLR